MYTWSRFSMTSSIAYVDAEILQILARLLCAYLHIEYIRHTYICTIRTMSIEG